MKKIGYIAVLLSVTIWSMAFVSSKILLEVLSPISIVFLRYFMASVFFVIVMVIRRKSFKISIKDIPLFMGSAGIGIVVYFLAELEGLKRLQASTATLILALIPLALIIVNRFTKTEKLSNTKKFASVGSIIGVAMVVGGDPTAGNFMGYLFMGIAVLSWVVYSFTTTTLTHRYDETKVTAYGAYITTLCFLPFFLSGDVDFTLVKTEHWMHLFFLGIVSSAIGFGLYNFALKEIGGTASSLAINFIPIITLVFGYIFLGETMNWVQLIGGFLIVVLMGFTIVDDVEKTLVVREHE